MTREYTDSEYRKIDRVADTIAEIESIIGSKFYGLENVTAKGLRTWSIAPRAPRVAVAAIKGTGHEAAPHIVRRWCNIRKAWRSIDLTTTRRVWYSHNGRTREFIFCD